MASGRARTRTSVGICRHKLRRITQLRYEDGLITSNPALGVRVIVRDDRPARRKHLTGDEMLRLLAEIPPEHADAMHLLATTGARISEALTARCDGIGHDAEGRPVLRFAQSKTKARLRPIPLTPETARMLTRRRAEAIDPDGLIFPNADGDRWASQDVESNRFGGLALDVRLRDKMLPTTDY